MNRNFKNKTLTPILRIAISKSKWVFILLFICGLCSGQSKKDASRDIYKSELYRYLSPKISTPNSKEILLFIVEPYEEPNSSIRIVKFNKKILLEVRYLEKNLLNVLFSNPKIQHKSLKTELMVIPISLAFCNKMLFAFDKIKIKKEIDGVIRIFDGTCYEFRINYNGKIKDGRISYELDNDDFASQLVNANLQIINDVKLQRFHEFKYLVYR